MSILPDKKLSVQAPTLLTVSIAADMNCYTHITYGRGKF